MFGEKIYDLLNDKNQVKTMEDKNGQIQFQGLKEIAVKNAEELLDIIKMGFSIRTTQSTVNNDESSRSHAICQVILKDDSRSKSGKLVLVDLAVYIVSYHRETREQLTLRKTIRIER